ncbi:hypothetical protein V8G54_018606 [Vigna mungo]|uniref:Uncharacterized protein n=1 Tax=Vigna mungo TaxID=3915 RepID=A0AAQ3NA65_VIGMU
MLTDLEADFINPYDASSRINYFIVPEFIGQGLLCAFCLLTGHWIMFLMTVPVTCYHVMLYMKQQHLIDVTEVFRALNSEKKFRLAKLAYYLTIIIITVFRLVCAALKIAYHYLLYFFVLHSHCLILYLFIFLINVMHWDCVRQASLFFVTIS